MNIPQYDRYLPGVFRGGIGSVVGIYAHLIVIDQ